MGLLYALLEAAPNSRLQSIKVVNALQNLYEARDLQLPMLGGHHLTTASDKMDRLDFAVRLLLRPEAAQGQHSVEEQNLQNVDPNRSA